MGGWNDGCVIINGINRSGGLIHAAAVRGPRDGAESLEATAEDQASACSWVLIACIFLTRLSERSEASEGGD